MTSVTLVLGEKSQSVSGNYTDVSWSLRLTPTRSVNANMTASAVIDGTTVSSYSGNPGYITYNTTKILASGTHRVNHNSNGTKTFNWSASARTNTQGQSWSFNVSNSGSRTLSRIPRTSSATLSSNTVQMGGSVTVGIQRASSSFTHSVRLTFGSYVNDAFTRSSSTSIKLNIPSASTLAKEIPNATSGSGSVRVTTFSGTTSIGSVTLPITLTVPSSVTPSVGTITIADTTNFHTLAGNFVQGRSKPRVNVSGSSGIYGSTIRSSVVNLGNRNLGSPGSTFTVPTAGTNNLSVTVTDSRGRTATKSFGNVTVLGYSAPVADVTAKRANADNSDNPYGTYLKFEGTTSVHNISLKGVANRRTVSVTRAVSGSSSTTSLYALNNSTTRSGSIPSPLGSNAILVTNSYDVVVTVTDSLGVSTVKRIAIPSGQVSLSVGKLGIGVGKVWERGALDVDGDVYISGSLNVKNPDGSLLVGVDGNLIPAIVDLPAVADAGNKGPLQRFGINANDPSIWVQGRRNHWIVARMPVRAGERYRLSGEARASVAGTVFFWQTHVADMDGNLMTPSESFGSWTDRTGSWLTSYPISNHRIVGANVWEPFSGEATATASGHITLYVYANHTNGTTNDAGYQWFRKLRFEVVESENGLRIDGKWYQQTGVVSSPGWTVARTDGNIYSGNMDVTQPFEPPAGWTFNWSAQGTTGYTFVSTAGGVPSGGKQTLRVMQVGSNSTTALRALAWQLVKD